MANLFIAVMYCDGELLDKVKEKLIEMYGEIKKQSKAYDFDKFTSYYEKEMGKNIKKIFFVFNKEINKNNISEIKVKTTETEKEYSVDGNRKINIDPGFIDKEGLFLASFKQKSFKEKLSEKVYLHKVLEFRDNCAITFFHTFPDYRTEKAKGFFI